MGPRVRRSNSETSPNQPISVVLTIRKNPSRSNAIQTVLGLPASQCNCCTPPRWSNALHVYHKTTPLLPALPCILPTQPRGPTSMAFFRHARSVKESALTNAFSYLIVNPEIPRKSCFVIVYDPAFAVSRKIDVLTSLESYTQPNLQSSH